MRRGGTNKIPQQDVELLLVDLIVSNSNDPDCATLEPFGPGSVVLDHFSSVVHRSVDLESHAQFGAVEIDDKPVNHMLASELKAQHAPPSQQLPSLSLSLGGVLPERPCPREFLLRNAPFGHLTDPSLGSPNMNQGPNIPVPEPRGRVHLLSQFRHFIPLSALAERGQG
jgi:hypothetical protein